MELEKHSDERQLYWSIEKKRILNVNISSVYSYIYQIKKTHKKF